MEKKEFTFMGLEMEKISIYYGIFLIAWGFAVSLLSQSNSFTSFIPSILGIPILTFGFLTLKFPERKKLFMHIVVIFGLIIALGGADVFRSLANPFANFWADLSKIVLFATGVLFTYLCVKSFIFARKNK